MQRYFVSNIVLSESILFAASTTLLSLMALASKGWEQEHDSRMKPNGCPQRLGRNFAIMDQGFHTDSSSYVDEENVQIIQDLTYVT